MSDNTVSSENDKPSLKRYQALLAITYGHAAKHLYNSAFRTLLMPEIKFGFGLNSAQYGILGTISSTSWWVFTMVGGYFGDRFPHHAGRMIAISLAGMGLGFFIVGFVPTYILLIPAFLLIGAGPSFFHPPALGELSRLFPDKRGFAISMHGFGANIGEVIGPLVVGYLLSHLFNWQDILKWSILPALLSALLMLLMVRSRPIKPLKDNKKFTYFLDLRAALKNPLLLMLILALATKSFSDGAVGYFIPVYLREDPLLQFTPNQVAYLFVISHILGAIIQPFMGYASDRLGWKIILVGGVSTIMFSTMLLGLSSVIVEFSIVKDLGISLIHLIVISILIWGSLHFSLHHTFIGASLDISGEESQSTVVSLVYGAGILALIAPYLFGLIIDSFGYYITFIIAGIFMVIPTGILATLKFPVKR